MDSPEGIYGILFSGAHSTGGGMLVLLGGQITGADEAGVEYNGTYEYSQGRLNLLLQISAPEGVTLVTGATSGRLPMTMSFPVSLPFPFGKSHVQRISTPTGQINVRVQRLRAL